MPGSIKIFLITCVLLFEMFAGCKQKKYVKNIVGVPGYEIQIPVVVELKSELDEISGLFFYQKDTSVFAIIDEAGFLYKIHLRNQVDIHKWKFSKKEDYEDILLADSVFYVLKSNGGITSVKFLSSDSLKETNYSFSLEGGNEFEAMYYDTEKRHIVLICKDCAGDKKRVTSVYSFDPQGGKYSDTAIFKINTKDIAQKLNTDDFKFRPSAAAIHPITNDVYIISSINHALVVTDKSGLVKEAYVLDPALFKQPEGLTFTPWGDMLISNEAAETGAPNILIFKYNAKRDKKG